jgi:cellulose synthase/poly-beta-1,6-N-acetylglucosamine synthase-like glycosyltransferase
MFADVLAMPWPLALIAACLFLVAFAYLIYPGVIWVSAKLFGRTADAPVVADSALPFVSLLIAAYNEEQHIADRLENALALDYPAERYEVVIASDGSTDDTTAVVRRYVAKHPDRVRLLDYPENRGKAAVLNDAVPELRGSVVALSDANSAMRPDALRRLAAWFTHPDVGAVCGRLVLTDPTTGDNVDSVYWKYETFLKKCESRLGALLGSNGAIYALRKNLFPDVPDGTIIDDFYIPLEAKRRSGCRIVYDTRAVACEETAPTIRDEFQRRSRIGAGGFQSIGLLWPLLWFPRHGWVAFAFLCHKVLRWVGPFLLLTALVANLWALDTLAGPAVMIAQLAGYALALVGRWLPNRPKPLKFLRLPAMFVSMNAALFVGFFKWLFRTQSGAWARTQRTGEQPALAVAEQQVTA